MKIEDCKQGDIVYFLTRGMYSQYNPELTVYYGIISDIIPETYHQYTDYKIYVDYLAVREHRYINDIPFQEFENTEWVSYKKSADVDQIEKDNLRIDFRLTKEEEDLLRSVKIDQKEILLEMCDIGLLVPQKTITQAFPHFQLERDRWRIAWENPARGCWRTDYEVLSPKELYSTYKEAKTELDRRKAEDAKIAAMSDEEYAIYESDNILNKLPDQKYAEACRKKIKELPNLGDCDFRRIGDTIQYRNAYDKDSKWTTITVTDGE